MAAARPPVRGRYPYRDHRTMAQVDAAALAFAEGRQRERSDVLAYIALMRACAARLAKRSPEHTEHARAFSRQCDIFHDDIIAALHECAEAPAALDGI